MFASSINHDVVSDLIIKSLNFQCVFMKCKICCSIIWCCVALQAAGWSEIVVPPTFNYEGVLCEKSAFSKNILGWSLLPIQQKMTRWSGTITTGGSPTWSRRRLSTTYPTLYPIPITYNLVLYRAWHCSTVGLVLICSVKLISLKLVLAYFVWYSEPT